ncbi:group 3 secretory phospholipase A2 [Scomber scombrus]|uniref:group 3 secretory phospholipase A2 n=1 Tax=Scomber scombrus TaxID=13677 RepID=UPI002DDA6290|nr:group 3 secretory phospholipase A2 [Scomber scombrus]
MTGIAALFALILTSSLLSCSAAETSILCAWTKVSSNQEVHYAFLRQAASSMRLYHTTWSGERTHLHGCSWSDDPVVIQNYFSLCQERTEDFSDHPDESFDLGPMFEAEDVCVSMATSQLAEHADGARKRAMRSLEGRQSREERSEVQSHQRVKRGFIVPGTLWCGSGNKAPSYEDLGVFSDTDGCCRDHDQCENNILSFQSKFGVFNSNIFTISHCDCDNKFRNCLKAANDSISDVVGYTFFNLLKMHCFVFAHRPECTERNWFGMCKETQMTVYAVVHGPTLYDIASQTDNSTNFFINATKPTGGLPSNMSDLHPFSIAAAASTVPIPSTGSASITPVTVVTASTGTRTSERPAPERRDDLHPFSIAAAASTVPIPSTGSASITPVTVVTASTGTRTSERPAPERRDDLHPFSIAAAASTVPIPSTGSASITPITVVTASTGTRTSEGLAPERRDDLQPFSIAAAASTVPIPSTSSASITPVTVVTASTGTRTLERPAPERRGDMGNTLPTKNQTLSEQDVTDNQLLCGMYKDLDECSSNIPPQQQRFGLLNSESRTLYHCNCTTRFFQTLAKQRQLTEVQTLLLGYVSQSCFLTQDCTEGNSCSAVVVKLELPQLDTEELQRHLLALRLKVRRPTTSRAKRRDRAIRLQRLCLRMVEKTANAVRGRKLI